MPAASRSRKKKNGGSSKRPPSKEAPEVQMFVRVPASVRDKLKQLADDDERTLAKYHARVLKDHVDQADN